jgi:hypothetical protein
MSFQCISVHFNGISEELVLLVNYRTRQHHCILVQPLYIHQLRHPILAVHSFGQQSLNCVHEACLHVKQNWITQTPISHYFIGSGYLHSEVLCMQSVKHFLDAQRLINIHTAWTNERTATSLIMNDECTKINRPQLYSRAHFATNISRIHTENRNSGRFRWPNGSRDRFPAPVKFCCYYFLRLFWPCSRGGSGLGA